MNAAVIGSGTMGNGIAHVLAQYGHQVNMIDLSPEALEKAMATIHKNADRQVKKEILSQAQKEELIARITTTGSLEEGIRNADIVIEAATENMEVKLKLFESMDSLAPAKAILATNTSSISITKLAAATKRPDKVIGMHFMNPVPVMKLVEVINGYATSEETTNTVLELSKGMDKIPVPANDYPGFVSNRILIPMINEAIYALHEGVAGVKEIDEVMKLGMAHPMGPLFLADFIGLDVVLNICRVLQDGFGQGKYAPCPLLVNMVTAGKLGRKSGEGFYDYNTDPKNPEVSKSFR